MSGLFATKEGVDSVLDSENKDGNAVQGVRPEAVSRSGKTGRIGSVRIGVGGRRRSRVIGWMRMWEQVF